MYEKNWHIVSAQKILPIIITMGSTAQVEGLTCIQKEYIFVTEKKKAMIGTDGLGWEVEDRKLLTDVFSVLG